MRYTELSSISTQLLYNYLLSSRQKWQVKSTKESLSPLSVVYFMPPF